MTMDRTKLLVHVRRISSLLEKAIREGPDGTLEGKFSNEHPEFVHHASVFYLAGCMAYLENEGGIKSWDMTGLHHTDFDDFIASLPANHPIHSKQMSKASLDALVCIRNACVHNTDDLSGNRDPNSLAKVQGANLPGVVLTGAKVSLNPEFLEFARLATLMVRTYHGD